MRHRYGCSKGKTQCPNKDCNRHKVFARNKYWLPARYNRWRYCSPPTLELQTRVTQEMASNPLLEQIEPEAVVEPDESDDESQAGESESSDTKNDDPPYASDGSEDDVDGSDEELARLVQMADEWRHRPSDSFQNAGSADDDEKRQYFFDSLVDEPSIQEQLLTQLRLADADAETNRLAELIIGSIDDQGYLRSHLADLITISGASQERMEKALRLVQGFEPAGIAARDLAECLLLQLERQGKKDCLAWRVVRQHLDDVARNHLPHVAKELGVSLTELGEAIREIRLLSPHPCSIMAPDNPFFIVPEVTVVKGDHGYELIYEESSLPRLRIAPHYFKLLENPDTPQATRDYIKEKLLSGKSLIKSLEQRRKTIIQIAQVIVDTQYDFLEKGIDGLKPLTMKQVAQKIGVHETTVSRAIACKYIQTPRGLLEFKFFFTSGYQASDGELISNRGVMEMIKDLVADEDSAKPLSDDHIAKVLKDKGIPVARRTVAKYREELGIPSSHLRREHQ